MILRAMLQRLYASLMAGPSLNARPHFSRQRVDVLELRNLQGADPAGMLEKLVSTDAAGFEFPARTPLFELPEYPESQWTEAERAAGADWDRQKRLLQKLRDIAADATDYFNDHGEHALFLGFPLLSLPPSLAPDRQGARNQRILAPLAFMPVNVQIRRGSIAGLRLEPAGDGSDLVQANPALLAWVEQQTGHGTDALFSDEAGEDPWREIAEIIALVTRAASVPTADPFNRRTVLQPVPRTDDLPRDPAILPCAVLGLFPLVNPGLLRDTKWMQETEENLVNPVRAFLRPEALVEPTVHSTASPPIISSPASTTNEPETEQPPNSTGPAPQAPRDHRGVRDFSAELLIANADPCQSAAVQHARRSAAVVVHGPPGTGKSQTIANIIGDHLARGERVLFVCDKRTALDVVHFRLDRMGLGPLCGVIHDPQRDRRDFYLSLRDRLEALAQDALRPDPNNALATTNSRLQELHGELRHCFDRLHDRGADGRQRSFHELCGEWLSLRPNVPEDISDLEGFTLDLLSNHRADAEEIVGRAVKARWVNNPYRGRLGISVADWLGTTPVRIREQLTAAETAARKLDDLDAPVVGMRAAAPGPPGGSTPSGPLVLDENIPARDQAAARRALAEQLEVAARRGLTDIASALARDSEWRRWSDAVLKLATEGSLLSQPIDRELLLQCGTQPPGLPECSRHLLALDEWAVLATSWTRFFAFGRRRTATAALRLLALPFTPPNLERARVFFRALKARHLWNDLRQQLLTKAGASGPGSVAAVPTNLSGGALPDEVLLALRDGLPELCELLTIAEQPANQAVRTLVSDALRDLPGATPALVVLLRASAQRADAIAHLEQLIHETALLHPPALAHLSAGWRRGEPALGVCQEFIAFHDTLDEAIRLTNRLTTLPKPLQTALEAITARGQPWAEAEPVLRSSALSREIRRRLREDEALARIDTQRVDAAFAELVERSGEKHQFVRERILHLWQDRWRARLLAATGSRLNSLGAALRQRLFVRGQKAMKLRPMIASGADVEGGDPLFDLCPVWMAGPATVAQIFPRVALFDVIVFDEASQCRLEEALPVLLRGRRVVIAGDPQQLPPTRFFESSLAESEDTGAESPEEVFVQQQSEAEDLLSAALNLNMQEAFLDVHYRSRHEGLIGFSNDAFYGGRLQPIPEHPRQRSAQPPIRLIRVDGLYRERGNEAEAEAAARLVAELLAAPEPPSIGVACFNLNQRDLILDALDELAAGDPVLAERLETARQRQGRDSFEGLFVKNLENVQGDERDHIIISTTFGPDAAGRFRRNFGALSRAGGERRLNVLVTRARETIHVLTSIPRTEYAGAPPDRTEPWTGRHHLYAYLRHAEQLAANHLPPSAPTPSTPARVISGDPATPIAGDSHTAARRDCRLAPTTARSTMAETLGRQLLATHGVGSTVYWGNDGFCVDVALANPEQPGDVTLGVLADFTRYAKTPDPIAWEQFRSAVLAEKGWHLRRVWSPALFRTPDEILRQIQTEHAARIGEAPVASAT